MRRKQRGRGREGKVLGEKMKNLKSEPAFTIHMCDFELSSFFFFSLSFFFI